MRFDGRPVYFISGGGLRVFTTLDTRAQRAAELAITRGRTPGGSASQAAAVMMNPYTGEIMAMVGGKDVGGKDEYNRAAAAKFRRSPGSSVKPLLFATALDAGVQQWDTFLDANLRINAPGTSCFGQYGVWCPKNFDGPGEDAFHVVGSAVATKTATIARRARSVTMESLIKDFDIARIDYLKMDIEGGEAEIILAADPSWLALVDAMKIELHDLDFDDFDRALSTRGFNCYPDSRHPSCIVAVRD